MAALLGFTLAMNGQPSSAAFLAYTTKDTLLSKYDVDRRTPTSYETRMISLWVEETWVGAGTGNFAAMWWLETDLLDFSPVDYAWGFPPAAPGISGRFNAASILSFTLGSASSRVVWSAETTNSQPQVNRAPAKFDVLSCLVTCSPMYTVTINSAGKTTAAYHSPGSSGAASGAALTASAAPSSVEIPFEVGDQRSLSAGLNVVNSAAGTLEKPLVTFTSTVERIASDEYLYGYEMVNESDFATTASWGAAGPGEHLLESGGGAFQTSFVSPHGPVERSGVASLVLQAEGMYEEDEPFSGTVQHLRTVPLPGAIWLLGGALAGLYVVAGSRRKVASAEAGRGTG